MPSDMNADPLGFLADLPNLDGAACAEPWQEAEDWFSNDERVKADAKAVCKSCQVRLECLDAAIERQERHGIYGGVDMAGNKNLDDWRARVLKERKRVAREIELSDLLAENRRASREAWDEIRGGA